MIALRPVYDKAGEPNVEAVGLLYQLLRERPPEANISHREMPTVRQHTAFVRSRPYTAWYVVQNSEKQYVGAIYLTKAREVGIAIFRAHQGKGYARQAITILRQKFPGKMLANVAPGNEASHTLFKALGSKVVGTTYELPERVRLKRSPA